LEFFDYFKIWEELEEVSMMKSVTNLISYPQKFYQMFPLLVAIFFLCGKLFSCISKKGKALTCGARMSVAKQPRAAPGLATQGVTAVTPAP
jgi:hypothetical protein